MAADVGILAFEFGGVVLALEWSWGKRVELWDRVVSRGRIPGFPPRGAVGRVIELDRPDTAGFTSNIIVAEFCGIRHRLKIEDIE